MVAASAGNHAQGVALAASLTGDPVDRLHARGGAAAEGRSDQAVRSGGRARRQGLRRRVRRRDRSSPEETAPSSSIPSIIRTSSPVRERSGCEIVEQMDDIGTVVVPVGGGGLISGIAAAIKSSSRPQVRIVGVQAKGAASFPESLGEGPKPSPSSTCSTIADGIAANTPAS